MLLLCAEGAYAQGGNTRDRNPRTKSSNVVDQARYNTPIGRVSHWRIGLLMGGKAGCTVAWGDLIEDGLAGFTAGYVVEKEVHRALNVRGSLMFGFCQGKQKEGDGSRTVFGELQVACKYRFLDHIRGYDNQRRFNPYLVLGAGGVFYHTINRAKEGSIFKGNVPVNLKDMVSSAKLAVAKFKPAGIAHGAFGLNIYVNPKISLYLEVADNIVFDDDFDKHRGWYNGRGEWVKSKTWYDSYATNCLGVMYRFFPASKYFTEHKLKNGNYGSAFRSSSRNGNRLRRR